MSKPLQAGNKREEGESRHWAHHPIDIHAEGPLKYKTGAIPEEVEQGVTFPSSLRVPHQHGGSLVKNRLPQKTEENNENLG